MSPFEYAMGAFFLMAFLTEAIIHFRKRRAKKALMAALREMRERDQRREQSTPKDQ